MEQLQRLQVLEAAADSGSSAAEQLLAASFNKNIANRNYHEWEYLGIFIQL